MKGRGGHTSGADGDVHLDGGDVCTLKVQFTVCKLYLNKSNTL